jgi:hypothetical protein
MGCSCKDKKTTETKKAVVEPVIEIQHQTDLTLEKIEEVHNLLPNINTNSTHRAVITTFAHQYLGETLMNYCDQNCQKRLASKFNALKKQITG